jgi:hypothetical protein
MANFRINKKRGQSGTEYLIIVGFVTLAIMAIIAIALGVSNQTKDRLKMNQVESFTTQLLNSAESVFFSGEPSKSTATLYLPEGVTNITIFSDQIFMKISMSTGENSRYFSSRVPLNGTIYPQEGSKRIVLEAKADYVQITQLT